MSPTKENKGEEMSRLLQAVRSKGNLYRAWMTVRSNVLASGREDFKKEIRQISENPNVRLDKLQRLLRSNKFVFKPQKARVKDGKRPIVISPIDNRIVQRAILNVLQSDHSKIQSQLGRLPEVASTETSIGGNPDKGVSDGIFLVQAAIKGGAKFYIKSDIQKFFTKIPKSRIVEIVLNETGDKKFSDFLRLALETELENEEEVKKQISLFPLGDVGVPQGSSLSAYAGNLILREFDQALNGRNITTIRYIDDFVMLGPSAEALEKAFERGINILKLLGMTAYRPGENKEKASEGKISTGFNFLGCSVLGNHVSPSKDAQQKLLGKVTAALNYGRKSVEEFANSDKKRRAEVAYAQTLDQVDNIVRGWGDSFAFCNDRMPFLRADKRIDEALNKFRGWVFNKSKAKSNAQVRRIMGVSVLGDTPHLTKKAGR